MSTGAVAFFVDEIGCELDDGNELEDEFWPNPTVVIGSCLFVAVLGPYAKRII